MGISLARVFKMEGILKDGGFTFGNALLCLPAGVLLTVIGELPHVFPIGGGVLQVPGNKGFPLPRDHESDARIRVQGIP